MEFIEKINITPDRSLYPKLGQTGYTVGEALAELIDNSVDARDKSVNIFVKVNTNKGYISIEDDGVGMNKEAAKESIILGKSNKKQGDLGQFGIGLKTACMSLGKKFTVETTTKNNNETYSIIFDEDDFIKNGNWLEHEIKIKNNTVKNFSGTKITIEKLKIKKYPTLIDVVKKHLIERFSPFIKNKEVVIEVNGEKLGVEELKIIPESKKNFIINLDNGIKIYGWTGILEVGSVERSGFNLYRYSRLIRAHEKLGYLYHPSKMWITGEIHLDSLPVTHNKREFITEDPLYIEFFDKFQEILKPLLAEAQKKHREERIKDLPKEIKETLKDNLMRALDETNDFKELAFPNSKISNRANDGDILSNQEKRDILTKKITEIKKENFGKQKDRNPQKVSEKKVRFINIAGKKYQFDYEWQSLDADSPKESYLDKERGLIMIILNSRYNILNVIKPDWFYHALYLTEGIVEVFLKENNQTLEKIFPLRDKLIKNLADVISEDVEDRITTKDTQIMAAQSYLLKNKEKDIDDKLTNSEKEVLGLKLEKGLKIADISNIIHVSRQRVHQLLNSAIDKVNNLDKSINNDKINNNFNKELISQAKGDIEKIINNITDNYGITREELLGNKRTSELVIPRHLAIYLLKKNLNLSFVKIAKIMDKKDHTTIIHAYKKMEKMIKEQAG